MTSNPGLRLALFACCLFWTLPLAGSDQPDAVRRVIDGYIVPNTRGLAESAGTLRTHVQDLCVSPSEDQLAQARGSFKTTALRYAAIEMLRFGPLEMDNRRDRLLFWPDRRSRGLKQVQRALATRDATVTRLSLLQHKSVALQGLGALEYLLFGTGWEGLATGDVFRCQFAASVAQNIAELSEQIAHDWQDDEGFAWQWTNPGADNPQFRNYDESLALLVGRVANGFEIIADQRLRPILSKEDREASYKRALFWRSDLTKRVLVANLNGLRGIMKMSGLMDMQQARELAIESNFDFDFNSIQTVVAQLPDDAEVMVTLPENASRLVYLSVAIRALQTLIGEDLAKALGLPSTFSPLDGD